MILVTVDSVCADHRESLVRSIATLPYTSYAYQHPVSNTLTSVLGSMIDFFGHMTTVATDETRVMVYPLDVARLHDEYSELERQLRHALVRKLGLRGRHVAVCIGGDTHEAFDKDVSTGRRLEYTLEDVFERARVLNDPVEFSRRSSDMFPGSSVHVLRTHPPGPSRADLEIQFNDTARPIDATRPPW